MVPPRILDMLIHLWGGIVGIRGGKTVEIRLTTPNPGIQFLHRKKTTGARTPKIRVQHKLANMETDNRTPN